MGLAGVGVEGCEWEGVKAEGDAVTLCQSRGTRLNTGRPGSK